MTAGHWQEAYAEMSAEQTISLVQRKARTGREAYAARAMSLGRALRLTAAKQADQMMGLALGVLGVARKQVGATEINTIFADSTLILLMDGPGTQVAAAVLDQALVAGFIQQQTMGRVTSVLQSEVARRLTATDAALCAPFVEALFARAASLPEEQADRDLITGYRFGVWAKDPRQAQLALDTPAYEVIEMTLDLAAGARSGKLTLIVPEPARAVVEAEPDGVNASLEGSTGTLVENTMSLRADLRIALTRFKLPLQRVSNLKAGDLLDIEVSSMAQALVLDASGRVVSRGTLGQINGVRALQVEQKKPIQQREPRRREADREELDLPDVTATPMPNVKHSDTDRPNIPQMKDVDIFGNLDDLPKMPDMDYDSEAKLEELHEPNTESEEALHKQAGW